MDGPAPKDLPSRLARSYVRILETLCGARDFRAAAKGLVEEIARATGSDAVSLRVHDRKNDYPYFVYTGFDQSFAEKESHLCERDADGRPVVDEDGAPALECMCGLVLRGQTDPARPFFTEYGSFRTNSTTELLKETTGEELGVKTRNTCNARGYESVALVPMRAGGRIVGLVQVNDRRPGRFDPPTMAFLERIAGHTGLAVRAAWRREELARLSKEFEDERRGVETMVALGEMTATLAHELKNPLAGMMLSATRLRKALGKLVDLEGQEKLESIADHLCSSIDTLSETVARIGRSVREPRLQRTVVDVNEVLESAMSLAAPRASAQKVNVVRQYATEADGLPGLWADAHYLMRAFLNLIVNALDVMPSGGILRLETTRLVRGHKEGDVEVTIADTGPGVREDEAQSLFRPFETGKPGGTGLGLGIVRRIVELHSGTVALLPREGGGTRAVVTLPVGRGRERLAVAADGREGNKDTQDVVHPDFL